MPVFCYFHSAMNLYTVTYKHTHSMTEITKYCYINEQVCVLVKTSITLSHLNCISVMA